MTSEDLKSLRTPLILLVAALIAAGGAIYYTNDLREKADRALLNQKGQLREAQTRMQRSGDEKTVIVQYVDKYRELQRAGIIGEEQRINWLDALRIANERTDLFGVNYQLSSQKNYPYAAEFDPGKIALKQTEMKVDLNLVHAVDLLRFFEVLRNQAGGLFHLDKCLLRRMVDTGAVRYQPNISASCEMSWITATPEPDQGGRP